MASIVDCEMAKREWKEEFGKKGENSFQPSPEVIEHMGVCKSCQDWCNRFYAAVLESCEKGLKHLILDEKGLEELVEGLKKV